MPEGVPGIGCCSTSTTGSSCGPSPTPARSWWSRSARPSSTGRTCRSRTDCGTSSGCAARGRRVNGPRGAGSRPRRADAAVRLLAPPPAVRRHDLAADDDLLRGPGRDPESLVTDGFRRLFLINGHGGNHELIQIAARDVALRHPVVVAAGSWWNIAWDVLVEAGGGDVGRLPGHAGGFETSLVMAMRPDVPLGELPDAARRRLSRGRRSAPLLAPRPDRGPRLLGLGRRLQRRPGAGLARGRRALPRGLGGGGRRAASRRWPGRRSRTRARARMCIRCATNRASDFVHLAHETAALRLVRPKIGAISRMCRTKSGTLRLVRASPARRGPACRPEIAYPARFRSRKARLRCGDPTASRPGCGGRLRSEWKGRPEVEPRRSI